jgi:hypothetical protein
MTVGGVDDENVDTEVAETSRLVGRFTVDADRHGGEELPL